MKEILEKYIKGNCSKEEFEKAVSILNGRSGEGILNDFMGKHWSNFFVEEGRGKEEKFELALHRIHHTINVNEQRESIFRRYYNGFAKVAAIMVLPLMIALAFFYGESRREVEDVFTTMSIPCGVKSQVDLPDGSKVWLNSGSKIKFPASFRGKDYRNIELDGEGYFQVASNKHKPFVVNTGSIAVEVLGTSFNVRAYNDDPNVLVALVEGRVKLLKDAGKELKELARLEPNQVGRYNKKKERLLLQSKRNLDQYVAWKDGKLVYVNEPFELVLRQMSRRYGVDYETKDPGVKRNRITATFIYESLEEFLKIIALSTPVEYKIIPGEKRADGSYGKRKVIIKERNE